jgi:hypothetical protein
MEKNLEPYVIIKDEDITFKGDTPQEQELNKWLYYTTLELNRYQDMTKEVLDYILSKVDDKTAQDIYKIIKDWNC